MTTNNGEFLNFLKKRGFVSQCTNEISLQKTLKQATTGYIGFDCTSDSLHVGSLLPLMILRNFQRFGHKPIVLLGGGTTLIGDPSGKDDTRKILSKKEITKNKKNLKKIFEKFISFKNSKTNSAILVDNYQWLSTLKLIDFLRNIGSKFSVNKMLSLESIKQRLNREQNLSFLEFNYSIFQAFDFLELYRNHNCKVQFGGSDQWGNIVSGIDLIKKLEKTEDIFGLTSPLITTTDGKKMGKSESGAIWLSEEKLNIQNFWQYWRNTSDEDVIKFLYLFTDIETEKIQKFKDYKGSELNNLKIILANEVTKICHGEKKSKEAEYEAKKILVNKELDEETIKNCDKKLVFKNTKKFKANLKEVLVNLNLCKSNGEAKRLILQGAIKINNEIITEKDATLTSGSFQSDEKNKKKFLVVYVGKKNYGIVELIC